MTAITTQQAAAQQSAKDLLANNQGFAQALAKILQNAAPAVGANYQNAAGEIGALGKGFGTAADQQAAGQQAELGGIFQNAGTPGAAVDAANAQAGGAVGDVTYGLGGFIPGSTLAREGAAFGAEAALAPRYAAGLGAQNANSISHDAMLKDRDFLAQIAAERAKVPGLANDILQQQETNYVNRMSAQAQIDYLRAQQRGQIGDVSGVDPVTGKPTLDAQKLAEKRAHDAAVLKQRQAHDAAVLKDARAKGFLPDPALSGRTGYLVDSHGNAIPDANGNRQPIYVKPTNPPKPGKNPRIAANKARENAFSTARHEMFTDAKSFHDTVPGDPNAPPGTAAAQSHTKPWTYERAAKYLFTQYKDLLRYSTRANRYQLKKRLNGLIREVLGAQGIFPPGAAPTGENG